MALSWREVENNPDFQALAPDQKQQAQQQYFDEVIAPAAGKDSERARIQFFNQYNYLPHQEEGLEPGLFGQIGEMITGSRRATATTEALPELAGFSGLFEGLDPVKAAQVVPVLAVTEDPNELAGIIKEAFPDDIGITYDRNVQTGDIFPIATNRRTGAAAVMNKPGLSAQDLLAGTAQASLFAAGGGAPGAIAKAGKAPQFVRQAAEKVGQAVARRPVAASVAGSAAGTTGIEAAQQAAGGQFDIENILFDMAAAFGMEALPQFLKARWQRSGMTAEEEAASLRREAIDLESERIEMPVSPESRAEQQERLFKDLSEEQKRQAGILQRVAGGPSMQLKDAPELVAPSAKRIKAAEDLGIELESVPAAVLSTNDPFIETMMALRSVTGSKLAEEDKAFRRTLANKAVEIIDNFGGTTELSDLSDRFKNEITDTIEEMDEKAEEIYAKINKAIPPETRHKPDVSGGYGFARKRHSLKNLGKYLSNKARDFGGVDNLSPLERSLFKMSHSRPTYAKMDMERKKIGRAIRKRKGVYRHEENGVLKKLYSEITRDQEIIAKDKGVGDLWDLAKKEVQQRKTLEDNTMFLLGKNVTGALMPKVGQAVRKLQNGDYKSFDEIMPKIPEEYRQEVVVSALNDAMTGGKSAGEQQLSVRKFVNWYEGLSSNPSAKRRIEKYLPEGASDRIKSIYELAKGTDVASKEFIGSGKIITALDNFGNDGGVVSKLYDTGKKVAAAEGAATSLGAPGTGTVSVIAATMAAGNKDKLSSAADEMLTDFNFKTMLKNYADTSVRAREKQEAAARALERSEKYNRWLSQLPEEERLKIARIGLISYFSGENKET